jgi:mannose-6-phosphate isomerase-like protein (cupin superfamily)
MQPPPHNGTGMSTAYRISDGVPNRAMEFRKRVLHPGASIGLHPIAHDEVYYVVSGAGVVSSDGKDAVVGPGDAAYLYDGNVVGIRQTGDEDLVLIISYPLSKRRD